MLVAPMPKTCSIAGCGRAALARGFCKKHWKRWRQHGDPSAVRRRTEHPPTCSVPDCGRPYLARGLCTRHYLRARKKGEAAPPNVPGRCWADGCHQSPDPDTGLCSEHAKIAREWEVDGEEALVVCCFKACAETIDPEMFGGDLACCPTHRRLVSYAMELEEWGVTEDAMGYLDLPDYLDAKWIAVILGREKENRHLLDKVYGDTPAFKIITATLGDLYPLLPDLT
jgi:hypothetical protein